MVAASTGRGGGAQRRRDRTSAIGAERVSGGDAAPRWRGIARVADAELLRRRGTLLSPKRAPAARGPVAAREHREVAHSNHHSPVDLERDQRSPLTIAT